MLIILDGQYQLVVYLRLGDILPTSLVMNSLKTEQAHYTHLWSRKWNGQNNFSWFHTMKECASNWRYYVISFVIKSQYIGCFKLRFFLSRLKLKWIWYDMLLNICKIFVESFLKGDNKNDLWKTQSPQHFHHRQPPFYI